MTVGKGLVSPLREPENPWAADEFAKVQEDIRAEESFLATCGTEGREREAFQACASLEPEDFSDPKHRLIFKSLKKLLGDDVDVNLLTLKDALEKDGSLSRIGGVSTLVEVLAKDDVGNPDFLVEIIKEKSRLRQIIREVHKASAKASSGEDSRQIITDLLTTMADIASSHTRKESIPLSDIVVDAKHGKPFSPHGCSSKIGCFGIDDLDHKCYIPIGEPTLIAARPGVGKTALAVQSAFKSAERGAKVLFVSMELTEEKLKARFAAYLTGVGADVWLAGEYSPFHADLLEKYRETLDSIRVISPDQGVPWSQLEADIRLNINKHGTNLVYIDYFGFIGLPKRERGENKSYLYADIMTGITALCKNAQIGIVVLCQLTKDATARGSKKPTLTELADTDRPARDAALTIMLYQLQDGRQTWASIAKNRNGSADYDKMVEFDGATNRFNAITHYTEER